MSVYQLFREQLIPARQDELWDFISSPRNLNRITPPYMGFDIVTPDLPEKMYPGMMITYKITPVMKIRITWVTEITHVDDGVFFVDEQRSGPYKIWHHEHRLLPQEDGVLMTDLVTYQPPFAVLGTIVHWLMIRRQLEEIFDFRRIALQKIFPGADASQGPMPT